MPAFPDNSVFKNMKITDVRNELANIDVSGKLFASLQKQRWRLAMDTIQMTTAQFQAIYPFMVKQTGSSGVFTLQYPLDPISTAVDGFDYSAKTFYLSRGSTSDDLPAGTASHSDAYVLGDQASPDGNGVMYGYQNDFVTFANHTKVYKLASNQVFYMTDYVDTPAGTLNLYPALVTAVPVNTAITIYRPNFTMRSMTDDTAFTTDQNGYYEMKLDLMENY